VSIKRAFVGEPFALNSAGRFRVTDWKLLTVDGRLGRHHPLSNACGWGWVPGPPDSRLVSCPRRWLGTTTLTASGCAAIQCAKTVESRTHDYSLSGVNSRIRLWSVR
jgi:hypothetical protein